MKITGLCNIYLNSPAKLALFKETFPKTYKISDNWLVYLRGKCAEEAKEFMKSLPEAKSRFTFFIALYESNWAKSTQHMLNHSKHEYVYIYLEDHFLIKSFEHFEGCLQDMIKNNIDCFGYSFFNVGLNTHNVEILHPAESSYFYSFKYQEQNHSLLVENAPSFYPFSLVSVASKKYFCSLLAIEGVKVIRVPYYLQAALDVLFKWRAPQNLRHLFVLNKILRPLKLRLTIYSPATPFNLEKSLANFDAHLWPVTIGILKEELFANWDDDHEIKNSSLIKRGLYPLTLRETMGTRIQQNRREYTWEKGERRQYQYFRNVSRLANAPLKEITVLSGTLSIRGLKEHYTLNAEDHITLYASIPHTLEALTKTHFTSSITNDPSIQKL